MGALDMAGVALAALLSENFVLVSCLGIGARPRAYEEPKEALRTGYCLTAVMVLAALLSWLCDYFILTQFGWEEFRVLFLTLLVLTLTAGLRRFLRVCLPELSRRVDGHLESVPANCAAFGAVLLASQRSYGLGEALVFALFGGIGATVVMVCFASLRKEVGFDSCPKCFRGTPILFITGGLMALALVGFYGLYLG